MAPHLLLQRAHFLTLWRPNTLENRVSRHFVKFDLLSSDTFLFSDLLSSDPVFSTSSHLRCFIMFYLSILSEVWLQNVLQIGIYDDTQIYKYWRGRIVNSCLSQLQDQMPKVLEAFEPFSCQQNPWNLTAETCPARVNLKPSASAFLNILEVTWVSAQSR